MLYTNIQKLFALRGITKPAKFLMQNGFTRTMAYNITSSRFTYLDMNKFEKLCIALSCTPNDLLEWQPNPSAAIPESHPLHALKPNPNSNLTEVLKNIPIPQIPEIIKAIETAKQNLKT